MKHKIRLGWFKRKNKEHWRRNNSLRWKDGKQFTGSSDWNTHVASLREIKIF